MALDEEQSSAEHEIRRAIDCLRECADLTGVDPATLEALAAGAVHFSLPAGSLLFDSGSTPDGVYLLASGRLGVKTPGMTHLTAEIGRAGRGRPDPAQFPGGGAGKALGRRDLGACLPRRLSEYS
jgi:hypothetical protein